MNASTERKYGKANKRKVLRAADAMANEAQERFADLPSWAGLGWIINPGWNYRAAGVCETMGDEWTARARMLIRALDIACRRV